jgi:NTE family protein
MRIGSKRRISWILQAWVFACLTFCIALHGQETEHPGKRIGLALSGGGARGAAHIGVLKVLEREGIKIDCIAGTSFGAIIAGLYAAGYTADEIEARVLDNWQGIFSDQPIRTKAPLLESQNLRHLVRLNVKGLSPSLPMGVLRGQKLIELLNQWTFKAIYTANYDFDQLPVPFRAVATDLLTGEPYIFKSGRLSEAIRASTSLPIYFSPVAKDGMLLVDGGMSNQLPTDILAEKMGADVVIGVDVTSSNLSYQEVGNVLSVMDQSLGLLIRQTVTSHYRYAQLIVRPELDGFKSTSYSRMREIIKRGVMAAEAQTVKIRTLLGKDNPISKEGPPVVVDPIIDSITFQPTSPLSHLQIPKSYLLRKVKAKPGDKVDPQKLNGDIQSLYATGSFEEVDYECRKVRENRCSLVYLLTESARNTLGLSLRYDREYKLQGLIEYTGRDLFGTTSYSTLSGRFGETGYQSATLRLIHPKLPFLFLEPQAQIVKRERFVTTPEGTVAYLDKRRGAQLMGGIRLFGSLEASAGYRFETGSFVPRNVRDPESPSIDLSGLQLRVRRDTLDAQEFPRTGMSLEFQIDSRMPRFGADLRYNTYQGEMQGHFSPTDKTTFTLRLAAFQSGGNLPIFDRAYLGGYGFSGSPSYRLAGFERDELAVPKMAIGGVAYRRQLFAWPMGFIGRGYLAAEYNMAGLDSAGSGIFAYDRTVHGGAIGLALDTMIGPIRIALGIGQAGKPRFYLSLGPSF